MAIFTCEFCGKTFSLNSSLKRHIRLHHQDSSLMMCSTCDIKFSNRKDYLKHIHLIEHSNKMDEASVYCGDCKRYIQKKAWNYHLRTNTHKANCVEESHTDIKCINSSFKNRIATYLFTNENKSNLIPENFLSPIKDKVIKLLNQMLQKHINIKFNCELFCKYMLVKEDDKACTTDVKSHQTKMMIINSSATRDSISQLYSDHCEDLIKKMGEFQERDSGWTLIEISHLEININEYKCLKGSQYIPPTTGNTEKACMH